jgi:alpha-tubulin suppressor-like RCC1 family protein
MLVVAAALGACVGACQGGGGDGDGVATVQVAVTAAPAGALCLRVTFTTGGSLSPTIIKQTADIGADGRTVVQFNGLPAGSATVSGEAFSVPCSALTASTLADWTAAPVSITIGATPVTANLVFTRGGSVVVSGDFPAAPFQVRQVAVGRFHTCAVLADQTTRCWGSNTQGQIGDGGAATSRLRPVVVSRAPALEVAAGDGFSCSVQLDGTVNCWGLATRNGSAAAQPFPAPVSGLTGVAHLASDDNHTCALLSDGTVRCWGENASGQLGNGTTTNSAAPVNPGLRGIVQLSEGGGTSYAVGADGTVWVWGNNASGQFADGTLTSASKPKRIAGLTNVVQVSGGLQHACARLADATLRCWGDDAVGEIGDGVAAPSMPRLAPVTVLSGFVFTDLSLGNQFTLAGLSSGQGQGWGSNGGGYLGNGTTTTPVLTPTLISGLSTISRLVTSSGATNACAILIDQSLVCWGLNADGNDGDGTTTRHVAPVAVRF